MTNGRSSKYDPPRTSFSSYCRIPDCDQDVVKCECIRSDGKPCACNGHPNFYKYGDDRMIPVVEHGHFLPNLDIGRNVNHKAGKPVHCPKDLRVYGWRLYQGADRWLKIPQEQKQAMGWY